MKQENKGEQVTNLSLNHTISSVILPSDFSFHEKRKPITSVSYSRRVSCNGTMIEWLSEDCYLRILREKSVLSVNYLLSNNFG